MFKYGEFLYSHDDTKKGFDLINKSASLGYHEAQEWVGYYYYNSITDYDFVKGIKWLSEAAKQGNTRAQYYLGKMHFEGNRRDKDSNKMPNNTNVTEALKWFKKASDGGHSEAKLYILASEGSFDAQYKLLNDYSDCHVSSDDAKAQQIGNFINSSISNKSSNEELFKLATVCGTNLAFSQKLLKNAAEKGHAIAALSIWEDMNYKKQEGAEKYLMIALNAGHPEAQFLQSAKLIKPHMRDSKLIYPLDDKNANKDIEEGMRLLRLSAEQGYDRAQKMLIRFEKTTK